MSRFYVPPENVKDNLISINGKEIHHIRDVMRLKEDDKVVVFDGTGKEYTGFIKEVKPNRLIVEIISTKTPKLEKLPEITLAQSIPKKEKMDYIVEKATELGVHAIIPILSERTVVKLDEKKAFGKVERWERIAKEAAKQCGRLDVPEIKDVQKFYSAIDEVNNFDLALVACLTDDTILLKNAISNFSGGRIIVFIGPEGDFTAEETKIAEENASCKFVSLGRRILKSDTAGLFVLSILNYEFTR